MNTGLIAIAAALALLPCAFAGLGMGLATGKAVDATARQPEASGQDQRIFDDGPCPDGILRHLRPGHRPHYHLHHGVRGMVHGNSTPLTLPSIWSTSWCCTFCCGC